MFVARLCSTAIVIAALGTAALAQEVNRYPQPLPGGGLQAQHHASTIQEGVLRGQADVIRAEGQYEYNTAAARLINEDAFSAHLDNDIKRVETYFARKERWSYYKEKTRPAPVTTEKIDRINKARLPRRLNADQVDPILGAIYWPEALLTADYADDRAELEALFEARVPGESGVGTKNHQEIKLVTARMIKQLKGQINDMPNQDWTTSKSFLDGLAFEARFEVKAEALANNERLRGSHTLADGRSDGKLEQDRSDI